MDCGELMKDNKRSVPLNSNAILLFCRLMERCLTNHMVYTSPFPIQMVRIWNLSDVNGFGIITLEYSMKNICSLELENDLHLSW